MRVAMVLQPGDQAGVGVAMGSVAIVGWELSRRLAQRHDVTLFCRRHPQLPAAEQVSERLRIHRIAARGKRARRAVELAGGLISPGRPLFASRYYFPKYFRSVARQIAADRCDVIHLQSFFQYAPLFRRLNPHATICLHMHSEWLTQLAWRVAKPALVASDLVLGCSGLVAEGIARRFPGQAHKCFTLYNGVDTGLFKPALAPRAPGPPRLLTVGRVSPEKGLHVLLAAFPQIAAACPGVTLDIVGQPGLLPYALLVGLSKDPLLRSLRPYYGRGKLGSVLRQFVHHKQGYVQDLKADLSAIDPSLLAQVHFWGPMGHDQLPGLYRQADVLVQPSLYESLGVPVMEAQACGTPVVAAAAGGLPEMIDPDRSGLLVPPADAEALAAAIIRLLTHPSLASSMAQHARDHATQRFDWDVLTRRLEGLYQQAQPVV